MTDISSRLKRNFQCPPKIAFSLILAVLIALTAHDRVHASSLEFAALPALFMQVMQTTGDTTQQDSIRGTVTSAKDDKPLPGVAVVVKGTKTGTSTDPKGQYSLEIPEGQNTLVFSLLGYQKKEVDINGRTVIDVSIEQEVESLEDVVVIGYGTQQKQDLTGSISSLSEDEVQQVPVTSADQALQGQVAGVQVTKNSGAPGGGSQVRIRGTNSIRAGNDPLYVIDGLPVSGESDASQNPLSLINPNDIVSIDVLKDASATAIYGSRGANGVVLITTKRGQAGDTQVNFETTLGFSEVRKELDLLNTEQWITMANEAAVNDGREPVYTESADSYGNTDWQNEIFRRAPQQNYQLSVSGGSEDTRFAISGSFFREEGILIGSDFNRGSFRINLDKKVSDRFTIGNSLTLSKVDYGLVETGGRGISSQDGTAGIVSRALELPPIVSVKDDEGNYVFQAPGIEQGPNPVATALEKTNENDRVRGLGNLFAEFTFMKGLEARVSIGGDINYRKQNYYAPKNTFEGQLKNSTARVATSQQFTWINENTLTYNTEFLDLHSLNVLAGFTMESTTFENLSGSSEGFITDAFTYNNLNGGELPNRPSTGASSSSLVSYIGRVNYSYDEKYLFTATGRVDGSSRFGEGNKYGFFPSAAFGWRISQEPFMENVDVVSNLKLRLSYGVTGNQEIEDFAALARLGPSQVTFSDRIVVGINPSSLGNEDLKWERTSQYNAGVDIGLLENRITLTGDVYYKKTTELLLLKRVPRYTGFSEYLDNIGSTENRGLELSLSTRNIAGREFQWNSKANFSINRNKVLELSDRGDLKTGTSTFYSGQQSYLIIREGEPLGSFFGYIYDGVYRDQEQIANSAQPGAEPGTPIIRDIGGPEGVPDGQIDTDGDTDKTIIGNAFPDFSFGLTNNFYYKGFDVGIFIQGVYGNEIINMNTFQLEDVTGLANQTTDVLDRWTPQNTNTNISRATRGGYGGNRVVSTRQIEDGSYLRVKNVTLGYNLPVEWTSVAGARSVRLYASATNLFTLTDYSGFDPEVSTYNNLGNLGADYGIYPRAKIFLFGINLGF